MCQISKRFNPAFARYCDVMSSEVATAKIATIVAGERPTDLARDKAVAYDVAAVLNGVLGCPRPYMRRA